MAKCISKFAVKSRSYPKGEPCKTICLVFDNGVVKITVLMLSDRKKVYGHKKLYAKFGKTIFTREIALKYTSFNAIHRQVTLDLIESNIKVTDIV